MDNRVSIGLHLCKSVEGIENEVIYNRLTKGKNNFTYDIKYTFIENIEDISAYDDLECIVIIGSKEEINRLNYKNLKFSSYGNFVFAMYKDYDINNPIEDSFDKINNYVVVKDKEKLVIAVKSFLDFIEKVSNIGIDYNLTFGNKGNEIMYFDEIKIHDVEKIYSFESFKNISKVTVIIYLSGKEGVLLKTNEIMTIMESKFNQNTEIAIALYECLDKELERIGLFVCTSCVDENKSMEDEFDTESFIFKRR